MRLLNTILAFVLITANSFANISISKGDNCQNDTEAPIGPSSLQVSNMTHTSLDLNWPAATDNCSVTTYQIYQDNVLIITTNGVTTNVTINGLTPTTTYEFYVHAYDAAGNESIERGFTRVRTKETPCGLTTTWLGTTGDWHDPLNWSLSAVPNACQDVIIPLTGEVTVLSGTNVIIQTLEVEKGGILDIQNNPDFHVIPSEAGPFNITGSFTYEIPGCVPDFFTPCENYLGFFSPTEVDINFNSDFILIFNYTITGNIIEITYPANPTFCLTLRIIDDNTLVSIGQNQIYTK